MSSPPVPSIAISARPTSTNAMPSAALNGRSDWPFQTVVHGDRVEIMTADVNATVATLLSAGVSLAALKVRPRTLEDLFIELTGRDIRQ